MDENKTYGTRLARLWKLFLSTLYIRSFTFGGGFVIVTFMKKKIVIGLLLAQLPLLHAVPVWGLSMNMDIITEQQIDNENDSLKLLELINDDKNKSVLHKTNDSEGVQLVSVYGHRDYHFST